MERIQDFMRPKSAVGLSLGAGGLKAVRLVRDGGLYKLAGVARSDFPLDREPAPQEIEAAAEAARRLIDGKDRVVANLRVKAAGLHFFDVPFDSPEKTKRVLRYEAEPLFLNPIDDMILDYLPLAGDDDGGRPGVVFGCSPDALTATLADLAMGGVDPDLVLPDRLALLTAGETLFSGHPPGPRLLIDLGARQTGLALFEGDRPLLIRSVFWGGWDLTRKLSEELNLDWLEAEWVKRDADLAGDDDAAEVLRRAWAPLVLEIDRTLAGAWPEDEDRTPELVLSGGGASTPGLQRFLADKSGLDVAPASAYTPPEGSWIEFEPDLAPAVGLAALGLRPGYQPNLRREEGGSLELLGRYRAPLIALGAGLLLLAAINIGGLYAAYRADQRRYADLKDEIEQVYRRAVPDATRVVAPLVQLRQKVEQSSGGNPITGARGRALDILLDVSQAAAEHQGLRITDLSLSPESLDLSGEGGSFEMVDTLKNQLEELPYFSQATLRGARVDPNTKILNFRVSLTRKVES